MTIYVDASLLIPLYLQERDSEAALSWFAERSSAEFLYSVWTDVEFASALSRKIRSGKLSPTQRDDIEAAYLSTKTASFRLVAVVPEHFRAAEAMVRLHQTGLRSGDALHLAIADSNDAAVATLDATMATAALHFGIAVERPA